MPFELRPDDTVPRINLFGTLSTEDTVRLGNELKALEDRAAFSGNRLVDVRGLTTIDVSFQHIFEQALRRRESVFPTPFRAAFVVTTPTQFGFARMYQTILDHPQITVEIFGEEDAALAWLAEGSLRRTAQDAPLGPRE